MVNTWASHWTKYYNAHKKSGMTPQEAMKKARATYKPKSGSKTSAVPKKKKMTDGKKMNLMKLKLSPKKKMTGEKKTKSKKMSKRSKGSGIDSNQLASGFSNLFGVASKILPMFL